MTRGQYFLVGLIPIFAATWGTYPLDRLHDFVTMIAFFAFGALNWHEGRTLR